MKKTRIILALALSVFLLNATHAQVSIGVSISANIAPPPLPVYVQPECPADGFLWTPGYWAYGDGGYFWVPGVWVRPPMVGYLWTPCYWGFAGGVYGYHAGYWGPHVGFYGGVNYGYGYGGSGFGGGRWEGGSFRYNTAVVRVNNTVIHNTYVDRTVIVNNRTVINNRTSYNGGPGGISARPSPGEQSALRERHVQATTEQSSHMQMASRDRNQFASVNHGRPSTTAMNTVGGNRLGHAGGSAVPPASHAVSNRPVNAPTVAHSNHATGISPAAHGNPNTVNHTAPVRRQPNVNSQPVAQQHQVQQPRQTQHIQQEHLQQQHVQQPHAQQQQHNPGPPARSEPRGREH